MKFLWIGVILEFLLIRQGFSESCKTCRGADCMVEDIFELDCTRFLPALPFESQVIFDEIDEDHKYGCLTLEYYIGDTIDHIQQCISSNNLQNYCSNLENVIQVESCQIEEPGFIRKIRDTPTEQLLVEVNTVEGSGETDDTDATTDSTGSTESPGTTPSSGVVHIISLITFISVIVLAKLF